LIRFNGFEVKSWGKKEEDAKLNFVESWKRPKGLPGLIRFDRFKLRLHIDTLRLHIDTMEQAGKHVREKEER